MDKSILLGDYLRRLNKVVSCITTREFEQQGITMPQVLVLRTIFHEPKTIGQISSAVQLSYSTVSGIIDRLERDQLVHRTRDEEDRRVVWIHRTDKIEEIKKQVPFFQEELTARLFQDLTEEQIDNIVSALELLIHQLEKKVEEKP
ncbi:MarR family winged helix-turn-helix transcriptional regulator [Brevibacillus ginsengisoli]|uniref:MarR family winged helix-turn-helix transcriptional regulator n=1 Tax=Brevibacillus ginsengisoli TaxID=363854 RepID=UPI003CF8046D